MQFIQDTRGVRRAFDLIFECKRKDEAVPAILPALQGDERFAPQPAAA